MVYFRDITLVLAGLLGISQPISAANGRFVNLSTRALVETGEEVMIGGFIIEDGARQVLIQALGPELANRGISNFLADPVLTLIKTSEGEPPRTELDPPIEIMANDDWEDSQGQLVRRIWGDFLNLTDDSASSALVRTLEPGGYTVKIEGKDGTAGIAIVEVYEINAPGADGRFVNLSTRALVQTEEEVMIGGFIIEDGARQVLIQALGPELANPPSSLSNALADPVLTVTNTTDPANPVELMVNDDWEDSQGQLVSDLWGGSPNLTAGSLSSAAVLTFEPGNYTAKVEGKDGTAGIAIVEMYGIDAPEMENPDREALTALYNAMDGANWTNNMNWLSDAPLDEWRGVRVDGEGRVIGLSLSDNRLSGSIPAELGNLASLQELDLSDNRLSGSIPAELRLLISLTELSLENNQLGGSIPAELASLNKLRTLALAGNNLKDPIPPELGNLANLEALRLGSNGLNGSIPAELGLLSNLVFLSIQDNQLNGEIPVELGLLTNLRELHLGQNQLSGAIPPELGNLANLEMLRLGSNELSGPIPPELASLTKLRTLALAGNNLEGEIPPELGNLPNLEAIYLGGNQFSGCFPIGLRIVLEGDLSMLGLQYCATISSDRAALIAFYNATEGANWTDSANWLTESPIGNWHGVTTDDAGRVSGLELPQNNLSGEIPPQLGNLTELRILNLEINNFQYGTKIPSQVWALSNLEHLQLQDTGIWGRIPPELGSLTKLRQLDLAGNNLQGEVPPQIEKLTELESLALNGNRMQGEIPPELASLPKLRVLSLAWNKLEGEIPAELGNLANLDFLDLNVNQLRGSIPPELGNLAKLRTLALANNNLKGVIPPELGNLANLEILSLNLNNLSGSIPPELGNLANLLTLILNDNLLNGPIPAELGNLANLQHLDLNFNQLSGTVPASLLALQELDAFDFWPNNGLCAPGTGPFVEWLGQIAQVDGLSCNETDIAALKSLFAVSGGADWTNADGWLDGAALGSWHGVVADSLGRVVELDLSRNGLSGRIPATLGHLDRLTSLRIGGNQLSGTIPWSLSRLSLGVLHYADTELCALDIPEVRTWLSAIPSHEGTDKECVLSEREILTVLYDATDGPNWFDNENWLTDAPLGEWEGIETEAGNIAKINLLGNNLKGQIPPELGLLDGLAILNLSGNYLPGEIPSQLSRLTELRQLDLLGIGLRGEIPPELGLLGKLDHLDLSHNVLTGSIPPELGSLGSLEFLRLSNNKLEGVLPGTLSSLVSLRHLNLSANMLSGEIPASLGQLRSLYELHLENNMFSGGVPAELGDLPEMYRFYLSGNSELSGPLPQNLTNDRLQQFLAHGTGLCAPDTPVFQEWLASRQFQRVRLCNWAEPTAYLTQATQSRGFPVPLVAGESALLRVFLTSRQETSETLPPVRATFFVNGSQTYVAEIPASSAVIPTEVQEGKLGLSANAEIPGSVIRPGLEMVVEIDPDGTVDPALGLQKRFPAEGRKAVDVRIMPTLKLTLVPFIWKGSNNRDTVDLVRELHPGHELFWQTNHLLPVETLEITKHEPVLVDSNDPFDLLSMTDQIRTAEGGDGHWMGLLLNDASSGISVALRPGKVSFVQPDDGSVIAHELGHNFSLGHAPCGVFEGLDPLFPDPRGRIGSWGYDPRGGGSLAQPGLPDVMSYCGPEWIGEYNFTKAAEFRISDEGKPSATLTASKSLLVSGRVDADSTLHIDPAFVIDAPPVLPNSSGPYSLTGRSDDGSQLFSLSFDMTQIADGDGRASFMFALPMRAEALASITLKGPGGSATLDQNTNRPMKILRNPRTGQVRGILRDSPLEAAGGCGRHSEGACGRRDSGFRGAVQPRYSGCRSLARPLQVNCEDQRGQALNRLTPQASSRLQGMTPTTDPVRHNFLRLGPFLLRDDRIFQTPLNLAVPFGSGLCGPAEYPTHLIVGFDTVLGFPEQYLVQ